MMYNKIKTGTQENNKRQLVFLCLFCEDAKPYKHYTGIENDKMDTKIPLVLMQLRWDGKIGFPGGKVEDGEDLKQAVIREVKEEIKYDVIDKENLVPLSTYATDKFNIHSFSYKVSDKILKNILKSSVKAEHFCSENQGCFLVQIANYKERKGYQEFIRNNFCATAGMELQDLVNKYNLLKRYN